ncbi:hypothetical protein VaNZ11_015416 [Volvox africanus]|uniref:Uncharacterized protein n=1 Tax=Volvox africanus TaxID=51714 RepID=A0ABQ5SLZ8_9CHLO|nr:hypothetical protein VaNZ11_015416 [Volvox africanus]
MAYTLSLQPTALPVFPATMAAAMPNATIGLGSLVFDCEVEEAPRDIVQPAPHSKERLAHNKEKLSHFSLPDNSYTLKLLRDVRYFMDEERDPDAILLATKLSAVGYSVNVRTALGGGTACFRNLRHEFLTVRGHDDYAGVEFIVEPRFREHFLIPHPTEEYSDLLEKAPDVFVGIGSRLVPIVQVLCEAMADSFERKALTLPPWRRTQSMLSKWLPNRMRDVSFSRASAPPHRAAEYHRNVLQGAPSGSVGAGSSSSDAASSFLRISDPLFGRGVQQRQQLQASAGGAAVQQQHAESRDEWTYATTSFIPFGGAGGCSSDTEGPSPPSGAYGTGPPGAVPGAHAGLSRLRCTTSASSGGAETAQTGAAVCSSVRRGGGHSSSLLASHFQQPPPGAAAAGECFHPRNQHQHPYRHQSGVLETRPPAYWGEAPIHRIRMGFQVASPKQDQCGLPQAQGRDSEAGEQDAVPEAPATSQL